MPEWREFRSPDSGALTTQMKTPVLLDGRESYGLGLKLQLGLEHLNTGRSGVDGR